LLQDKTTHTTASPDSLKTAQSPSTTLLQDAYEKSKDKNILLKLIKEHAKNHDFEKAQEEITTLINK
jgi:hypothetical protein